MKRALIFFLIASLGYASDDDFAFHPSHVVVGNGTSTSAGSFDLVTGDYLVVSNSSTYDSLTGTYSFNGSGQYLSYQSTNILQFTTNSTFTVFVVMSTTTAEIFGGIVSKWGSSPNVGWFMALYKPAANHILVGQIQNGPEAYMLGSTDLNDGAYHVLTMVYSGVPTTNGITLYVDGSRETMTGSGATVVTDFKNDRRVCIGARDSNLAESPLAANIRHVEFYEFDFSDAQVSRRARDLALKFITR